MYSSLILICDLILDVMDKLDLSKKKKNLSQIQYKIEIFEFHYPDK